MRIGFNRACLVSWLTVFILSSFSSFSSIHPFCSRESCSLPNMTVEIRCHYDVLGVERSADAATIKKAHRKLALKLHPDKNIGDDTAAEQFRLVQQAYVWQAQKLGSDVSFCWLMFLQFLLQVRMLIWSYWTEVVRWSSRGYTEGVVGK